LEQTAPANSICRCRGQTPWSTAWSARAPRTRCVLQAAIGFTQYYNGIPALLVGAHMLAAALLMSAATNAADLARYSPVD